MSPKLKKFLKIGLEVAKITVPGVAGVEEGVKALTSGADKGEAVLQLIKSGLLAGGTVASQEDILDLIEDPEFITGLEQVRDGQVKIMKAIKRLKNSPTPQ